MGIIGMLMLIAMPALTRFKAEERFVLAARQYITAYRAARQLAISEKRRVLLTLDYSAEGLLQVRAFEYYYKPALIDNEPGDSNGLGDTYRGKNYRYCLGDLKGRASADVDADADGDIDFDARPVHAKISKLPKGIDIFNDRFPGRDGHQDPASKYWFVYPDVNGEYHGGCDRMLVFDGGAPSQPVDPANSLRQADVAMFGTLPSGDNRYWVDINPNGTVDDGSQNDEVVAEFQDQVSGGRIQVVISKLTGNVFTR